MAMDVSLSVWVHIQIEIVPLTRSGMMIRVSPKAFTAPPRLFKAYWNGKQLMSGNLRREATIRYLKKHC